MRCSQVFVVVVDFCFVLFCFVMFFVHTGQGRIDLLYVGSLIQLS